MLVNAAGWILLFALSVVLLYATTGGPIRYDDGDPPEADWDRVHNGPDD